MKIKPEMNTYCPKCRKHTKHKVKAAKKGAARSMAWGTRKHKRKLIGYGGKVAGEKTVRKMGKRQKLMLQCTECKKKHERVLRGRTRVKIEIKA